MAKGLPERPAFAPKVLRVCPFRHSRARPLFVRLRTCGLRHQDFTRQGGCKRETESYQSRARRSWDHTSGFWNTVEA